MRKILTVLLSLPVLTLVSCNGRSAGQGEDGIVCISKEMQEQIVTEYVEALVEFARLTPVIGGDDESYWAAEECEKLAKAVIEDVGGSYLKRMSEIYLMQAYCGYSLSYAISCWAMYECEDSTAAKAFHSAAVADKLYDEIADGRFSDYGKILRLAGFSFYYIQLYPHLYNQLRQQDGSQPVFQEDGFGCSLDAVAMTDCLLSLNVDSAKIFRVANVLEATSFFWTFCPLVQALAQSEEKYNAQRAAVLEFAAFCDSGASEVSSSFSSNPARTKVMEGIEFDNFMLQALKYKTAMLSMLSENIRDMAEQ